MLELHLELDEYKEIDIIKLSTLRNVLLEKQSKNKQIVLLSFPYLFNYHPVLFSISEYKIETKKQTQGCTE
jgi:hypothetical protein